MKTILYCLVPDKAHFLNLKVLLFFFFLYENICCGYSLEVPHQGTSIEYQQHMLSSRYNITKTRLFKYIENFYNKKGKFSDKKF